MLYGNYRLHYIKRTPAGKSFNGKKVGVGEKCLKLGRNKSHRVYQWSLITDIVCNNKLIFLVF